MEREGRRRPWGKTDEDETKEEVEEWAESQREAEEPGDKSRSGSR